MMRKTLSAIAGLAILGAAATRAAQPYEVQRARTALAASARAYKHVRSLQDTLTYVVKAPSADPEPKRIEIRLGPGTDVSVADALLEAIGVGHMFYLTKSDAPGKYIARSYSGDFGESLRAVVGDQSSIFEPAEVSMRLGKSLDRCIDGLRFNQLAPLRIAG